MGKSYKIDFDEENFYKALIGLYITIPSLLFTSWNYLAPLIIFLGIIGALLISFKMSINFILMIYNAIVALVVIGLLIYISYIKSLIKS